MARLPLIRLCCLAIAGLPVLTQAGERTNPAPKQAKPKFTISKETTVVAGPLDKDGFIDYPAALNERMRKGVTPKTNANVLIWQAIGPRPEGAPMPAEYFQWLQIEAPPDRGDYFIGLEPFIKEHLQFKDPEQAEAVRNQQTNATQRPWTAQQYRHIAAWIKINEKSIALVIEATKRPHYFSPLVPDKNEKGSRGLLTANVSGVQKTREVAAVLAARALMRVEAGKYDEAWQDLLACHRLGRHVGNGATLIEALVGIALDHIASAADLAFLERVKLDAKQARACLADLQRLPPLPAMADKIDQGERFFFLDSVMLIGRGGPEALADLGSGKPADKKLSAINQRFLETVDWDPALRNGNQWYDRLVAAMRTEDRPAREKQLQQITDEIREMHSKNISAANMARVILGTPQAKGKVLGDILSALLLPAFHRVQHAADRNEQVQRNLYLAFALAAYRRDHGRYPATLDDLARSNQPYLPKVEPDLFTGKPLVYRPTNNGYLLYSFGVNGHDDEARGYDDDPRGDDLAVRMPLPKLREK